MSTQIELLQFYRCKTLPDLLDRASDTFANIGFPHLVLKWNPAPASACKMKENSSMIWNNFDVRIGHSAKEISRTLQESIVIGTSRAPEDTLNLQRWRETQEGSYRLAGDAPKPFFLTKYQQSIIQDFGEAPWTEFLVRRLTRERERMLVVEAKTQERLTQGMMEDAHAVLSVVASVYLCLHRPINGGDTKPDREHLAAELSRREIQCLQWLAAGKTYSEAAIILDVSERTLRFHVGNARNKLGVSTTMQAVVAAALEYGFDPKDPRRSIYQTSRTPVPSLTRKVV